MPQFKKLTGEVLDYGNKRNGYDLDSEKAFSLSLDKLARSANLNSQNDVAVMQFNLNQISKILNLDLLPENGILDNATQESIQYFVSNADLFKEHGISDHITAKKLEKTTNPAFTETEHAPTIDEMKALEVDIGKLYS